MNFDDYCAQKAAPPGSSVYYALLYAPAASRLWLTALYALRCELEETVGSRHDPTVNHVKFAWWQKEIASLLAGRASHPVSLALAAHGNDLRAEQNTLQMLIAGFEMDLNQARYLDFVNLQRYIECVGGHFAAAIARSTAKDSTHAPQWAAPLGNALMLAQFVQEVGNDARHGRIYIPIDELQRYQIKAADLMNRKYSAAFIELMRFQTNRARNALKEALAGIPTAEYDSQRTLRVQTALALATLDEIERDDYQILHQRIALTPLHKFWIAWRTARKRKK